MKKTFFIGMLIAFLSLVITPPYVDAAPAKVVTKTVMVVDTTVKKSLVNLDSLMVAIPVIIKELKDAKETKPITGSTFWEYFWWLLGLVILLYDQVVRVIPTVRNYTVTHILEQLFAILPKIFTGSANVAKLPDGTTGIFKSEPVVPGKDTPAPS